jgi:hypothetical protein
VHREKRRKWHYTTSFREKWFQGEEQAKREKGCTIELWTEGEKR